MCRLQFYRNIQKKSTNPSIRTLVSTLQCRFLCVFRILPYTHSAKASASFFGPFDINNEPFIRVAVGDYYDLLNKSDKDDALAVILVSITHELTHYFQWIKHHDEWCYADDVLNNYYERQALYYANVIVYSDYANIVDHP